MTKAELKTKVLDILKRRYPDYATKPGGERVLLAMSVLCRDLKVREKGGNNSGPEVEALIESTGLNPKGKYPWCAATIEFACEVADVTLGPKDPNSARVSAWRTWASENGRMKRDPARGRLCSFLNRDGTGHIGIVAEVYPDGSTRTFEGNTASGHGNQREGDGLYERKREKGFWSGYIDLTT